MGLIFIYDLLLFSPWYNNVYHPTILRASFIRNKSHFQIVERSQSKGNFIKDKLSVCKSMNNTFWIYTWQIRETFTFTHFFTIRVRKSL